MKSHNSTRNLKDINKIDIRRLSLFLSSNVKLREHRHLFHSKNICPPPLPYFKVNIYPFPLPHFASIFFAYLWSFRWPNYIVTLPRYFSFQLPHLNISTGPPSDKLDKNSQRMWLIKNFSQWNGYNNFRSSLNWFRKFKKRCFKNQMSVIWSWTYFYNLHWNNYLYFKGLLYIWEEMIMWHCYTWPV